MTRRIFRSILCTSLCTLLASLLLAMGILYRYYDARLLQELYTTAEYLGQGASEQGSGYLAALPDVGDRITLIAADGTVLYDNRTQASQLANHADRAEVAAALAFGRGEAVRRSDTLSQKTCYSALRLPDGSVLRLGRAQSTVWALLLRLLPAFLLAAALLAGCSAWVAARLSRRIMQPLDQLDLDAPAQQETYAELSPLLRRLSAQNRRIAAQMEELRRRQKEFAVVADNMSEGLLMVDAAAAVLLCNRSMAEFLQAPQKDGQVQAVGQNALLLNHSEVFRQVTGQALAGVGSTGILSLNGRSYELLANPVLDAAPAPEAGAPTPEQHVTGAVVLMVDVTEREQRERLRREFTANVSHELKTPLTAIYGAAELLANGIVRPEDVPGFARDIHAQAERMIRLIEDILRLSQLDEGGLSAQKEPVDLYAAAVQVCGEQQAAAVQAGVHLTVTGQPVIIQGVPAILHELAANLCDNAIKYNRPGGSVQVYAGPGGDGRPVLRVADTGIGIPKEHQSRVFERFYRVDKSHSRRIGGTGLGLSIVKHAAMVHGAELSLESQPGVGTTITVTFP